MTGPTGPTGAVPSVTVAESTPTSYKINFKTDTQDITTPNLLAVMDTRNVDLSTLNSSVDIPIGKLILTYQNTSANSIRISVRAADASTPVLTDMRRSTIYDAIAVEAQTFNNTTVTTAVVLDDLMYSQSQESHWMRIRQQDPATKLWSMCMVYSFASQNGSRTSISIQWLYTGASFSKP